MDVIHKIKQRPLLFFVFKLTKKAAVIYLVTLYCYIKEGKVVNIKPNHKFHS